MAFIGPDLGATIVKATAQESPIAVSQIHCVFSLVGFPSHIPNITSLCMHGNKIPANSYLHLCLFLQLESLGQSELASRLTLNCQNSYVEPHKIRDIPVTIMDVSFS